MALFLAQIQKHTHHADNITNGMVVSFFVTPTSAQG